MIYNLLLKHLYINFTSIAKSLAVIMCAAVLMMAFSISCILIVGVLFSETELKGTLNLYNQRNEIIVQRSNIAHSNQDVLSDYGRNLYGALYTKEFVINIPGQQIENGSYKVFSKLSKQKPVQPLLIHT